MTPARLQTIEEIFHAALDQPPDQLRAFLARSCAGDEELQRRVEALLASHREAGSFIETPIATLDASIVENEQPDVLIGQTIGHYKISRPIGAGGMGMVYLAERADRQYEKQVAIKLIKRGMDTDSVLRHFRNERQILANFDHPNIARLLDGGATEDGLPYFVMEYAEGVPIEAFCERQNLSVADRLNLFRQVCGAVTYAHGHAVIHRDIKPSNILVMTDGTPKLLDFGIAKILQSGDDAEQLATLTGLRLMTPEYASPEQLRSQPVTTATDVYSLGVVLYLLLTGQKPYRLTTRTPEEMSRAIVEQEPPPPSSAVAAKRDGNSKILKGDLDNIVLMALRKDPERRYQSVEQFSEDIRRHLEALPVRARKDTFIYRSAKFLRRNRAATAAAVLVFLSLLGGIIATTWEAHHARAEKARAERRFNDVRQLAHSVLFDYYDSIKDLPGATRVRERLGKDALKYLDSLAGEAGGDPALQRELAAAYDRVGDVRGQVYNASLGDTAGAMDSYLKALRIREALVAADPKDGQSRRELANNHRKIGWQLIDSSEASRGLNHLQKAVALYLELTAEQPDNADLQDELALAYNQLGLTLEDRGDLTGALDQHRRAMALREKLMTRNPAEQKYRRGLSVTDEDIGRALFLSGDAAGALEMNDKALALRKALLVEDPINADYRRILAISYQNDGDYCDELGDKQRALDSFRRNISINEESLVADPANAAAHYYLGYSSQRAGDLLAALENNSEALLHYQKSEEMYEKTLADAPGDFTTSCRLAVSCAGVGKIQARLGNNAPALEECLKGIALLAEAAEENQTNANHRSMRAQAYASLGEAYVALTTAQPALVEETRQHWTAARDLYWQSLNIWADMRSRHILSVPDSGKPEEVAHEIAKCDAFLGK